MVILVCDVVGDAAEAVGGLAALDWLEERLSVADHVLDAANGVMTVQVRPASAISYVLSSPYMEFKMAYLGIINTMKLETGVAM